MIRSTSSGRFLAVVGAVAVAQAGWAATPADRLTVTAEDQRAAAQVTAPFRHLKPANGPLAQERKAGNIARQGPARAEASSGAQAGAFATGPRFPGDLTYHGGAVLKNVVSHNIYLDGSGACTTGACWGDPERYLKDLSKSKFIHLVDEFTGSDQDGRYTVGPPVHTSTPSGTLLTDNDALAVVHAAAKASGKTGYGHMYHVFLAPGTDLCFDSSYSVCYSPDNGPTFYFCAYHSSVDFADVGHVVYSVEPYQNVSGCSVRPGTPNGQLVDSTNSVLSHELFEAITDPDGDGWWNSTDNANYFNENGDECSFITYVSPRYYFDPSLYVANGRFYATQPEYSNARHSCTTEP